ncbi:hypothetical protein T439DRAFT_320914 [Meredithblackwellia eburnea MCA 4105]
MTASLVSARVGSVFVEGDIQGPFPSLAELEAFGVFESTHDLIVEYLTQHGSPLPPTAAEAPPSLSRWAQPARRPLLAYTSSAPSVQQITTEKKSSFRSRRPGSLSRRPLSTSDVPLVSNSRNALVSPPASPLSRSTGFPSLLRAIRNSGSSGDEPRKVVIQDSRKSERPRVPTLVTDSDFLSASAGPSFSPHLSTSPIDSGRLSPSVTFERRRSLSMRLSPSSSGVASPTFEMDEPELNRHPRKLVRSPSPSPPRVLRRRNTGKNNRGGKSSESSEDSYHGDEEGDAKSTRRRSTGGESGSISPSSAAQSSSKWVRALKIGLGSKKTPRRPSSITSEASATWDMLEESDESSSVRPSFEVLHRRPAPVRSQSTTSVEISSKGNMIGESLLEFANTAASTSTPALGMIEERPEAERAPIARPTHLVDFPPSGSNLPTPIPSPSISTTTHSTPRVSSVRPLEFAKITATSASTSNPPSLLSASRPATPPVPLCLAANVDVLARATQGEDVLSSLTVDHCPRLSSSSSSSSDELSRTHSRIPTDFSSSTSCPPTPGTPDSSVPPTPELESSGRVGVSELFCPSPTGLKRSAAAKALSGKPHFGYGPSDSEISLTSATSSSHTSEVELDSETTPATSAAEGDGDDEEMERGIWRLKGRIQQIDVDSLTAEDVESGGDGAMRVW